MTAWIRSLGLAGVTLLMGGCRGGTEPPSASVYQVSYELDGAPRSVGWPGEEGAPTVEYVESHVAAATTPERFTLATWVTPAAVGLYPFTRTGQLLDRYLVVQTLDAAGDPVGEWRTGDGTGWVAIDSIDAGANLVFGRFEASLTASSTELPVQRLVRGAFRLPAGHAPPNPNP